MEVGSESYCSGRSRVRIFSELENLRSRVRETLPSYPAVGSLRPRPETVWPTPSFLFFVPAWPLPHGTGRGPSAFATALSLLLIDLTSLRHGSLSIDRVEGSNHRFLVVAATITGTRTRFTGRLLSPNHTPRSSRS